MNTYKTTFLIINIIFNLWAGAMSTVNQRFFTEQFSLGFYATEKR